MIMSVYAMVDLKSNGRHRCLDVRGASKREHVMANLFLQVLSQKIRTMRGKPAICGASCCLPVSKARSLRSSMASFPSCTCSPPSPSSLN